MDRDALQRVLAKVAAGSAVKVLSDGKIAEGSLIPSGRLRLAPSGTEEMNLNLVTVDRIWQLRRSKWKGHLVGAVVGGGIGAAVLTSALLKFKDFGCGFDTSNCTEANDAGPVFVGVVVGGIVGGGLGAMIGNFSSSGTLLWIERYPLDKW